MCGIAGFYHATVTSSQVDKVIDRLRHRGPDDQNTFVADNVGLMHTRLSIIELSALGAQPYHFENLSVVYNGEIYNYKEVREELKAKGYAFQSDSDTEVLIKAFHCWREACVEKFIGMFAFALYDKQEDCLWIFRDRLGVKPVYYYEKNGSLFFASELKALAVFEMGRAIDEDALFFYFRFGYTPAHRSIFKDVKKLQGGCYLRINRTGTSVTRYWNPSHEVNHTKTESQWLEELEQLMVSAFRYRMVSDVPVGVFLSGGIDSSLLAAILTRHYGPVQSFTIGFNEQSFDESRHAAAIANHLGIQYTERKLDLSAARSILDTFYSIYDEPFSDTSGIPTLSVTQLAREHQVKVVLSADGGDELFGGYTHYQKTWNLLNKFSKIPLPIRKGMVASSRAIFSKAVRKKVVYKNFEHKAYALEELLLADDPIHFYEAYVANQSIEEVANLTSYTGDYLIGLKTEGHSMQKMMWWDIQHYLADDLLVKVDRATMHESLECREPFLDHRLVELSLRMPISMKIREGTEKYIVKKLLSQYIPPSLFERKKQGFSIPLFSWFSSELDVMFTTHLNKESLASIPYLNDEEVQSEYKKYRYYKARGKDYNIEKMWRILSFVVWYRKWIG